MQGTFDGRARIFLSCGQNKATEEPELAISIGEHLKQLGYNVYIATQEQSILGLRENLFSRLKYSEYFVFIDFKRKKSGDKENAFHRVSLFSHQELAIASYIGHPLLAFQEEGIEQLDGMLGIIQDNVITFSDRLKLPSMVFDEIKSRPDWKPNWRNEIVLKRESEEKTDPVVATNGQMARFFHINAINRHKSQIANNCYVYLEAIRDVTRDSIIEIKTVELKWAGYILPNAAIMPNNRRLFDAGIVFHSDPTRFHIAAFTDASDYRPRIDGVGDYELRYVLISDNFPPARCTLNLHLDRVIELVTLTSVA